MAVGIFISILRILAILGRVLSLRSEKMVLLTPSRRHSGGESPAAGRHPQTSQILGHFPGGILRRGCAIFSGGAGDRRQVMEQITTKEQAVELIEGIVRNERFKVDAYFFCGFPTDQPNEKLIKVCENYLEKRDPETKSAMLSEMERMAAAGSVLDAGKNVLGSAADIQRVLEAKELL